MYIFQITTVSRSEGHENYNERRLPITAKLYSQLFTIPWVGAALFTQPLSLSLLTDACGQPSERMRDSSSYTRYLRKLFMLM